MSLSGSQKVVIIALISHLYDVIFDDDEKDEYECIQNDNPFAHMAIGDVPARDVFGDISNTAYFYHWANMPPAMFDYIRNRMREPLSQARNIHFIYSDEENSLRKRRPCKISIDNRKWYLCK